jgi:hypothetical protein
MKTMREFKPLSQKLFEHDGILHLPLNSSELLSQQFSDKVSSKESCPAILPEF